ncbi:hypothetical protein Tco_0783774 [Tanacetum coccineum]
MFVDYRTDLGEGSSKRVGDELIQEVTKKQTVDDVQETAEVDDDQEAAKIKELMEIVPDEEEVAIDAIPLATKPPTIDYKVLDWKLYDSGGFHSLRMQHIHIHMLVEKRYPLTPATITDMLNKKLQWTVVKLLPVRKLLTTATSEVLLLVAPRVKTGVCWPSEEVPYCWR